MLPHYFCRYYVRAAAQAKLVSEHLEPTHSAPILFLHGVAGLMTYIGFIADLAALGACSS